jgi:hypothetical protein
MAYTVTVTRHGPGGRDIVALLAGASVTATLEATIPLGVKTATLWRVESTLDSGSAATTAPVLGADANPASARNIWTNGGAASSHDDQPNSGAGIRVETSDSLLYWRDVPNTGSDNATTTRLYFTVGWI